MVHPRRRCALTLTELLVVVAILGVLIALLVPAVQRVRDRGLRVECANNLRQIGVSLHSYHGSYSSFPPGMRSAPDPFPFLSWHGRILPFLEQEALWRQLQLGFKEDPRFWIEPPHQGIKTVLPVLLCPANLQDHHLVYPENVDVAFTTYLGVEGLNSAMRDGILFFDSRVRLSDITDGTSTTLVAGERPPSPDFRFGWWYAGVGQALDGSADMILGVEEHKYTFRAPTCMEGPYRFSPGSLENMCDTFHYWSLHIGGANFLFADGSVRFLPYTAVDLMPALASRAGGELTNLAD